MTKPKFETPDLAQKNIEKLQELFPNCVTEGRDENGRLKKAVNFELLQQMLSDDIADKDEAYEFTWVGKNYAIVEANKPIRKTLRPCKEESVNWDTTENLYIEGDNLEVLKLLQESYLGKVKMIYIDPPYNTGNDFIYRDDFASSSEEYAEESGQIDDEGNRMFKNTDTNGRFHSDWCSMIYSRLLLARNLLSDDGVIFISIDDNEVENLKKICSEVFGEGNLVAEIPWQSRASIQNDTDFSVNHEYICVYAKKRRQENRRLKESNATEWRKKDSFVCKPLPLEKEKFDNPDNDPRGPWKADPFDAPHVRQNLTYPITNPDTGEQHLPPRGRHWRISPEKFANALADNRIVWTNGGKGRPQLKVFYEEKKDYGSVDNSWFSAERVGTSTNGTKELMKLFDGESYFDTPKPTSLMKKLIDLANLQETDVILDFFSGSATTAHAVMQLNAEDGGHRKFIMVQLPEVCDEKSEAFKAGYKNICEIGKERIRRAGAKILEENKQTDLLRSNDLRSEKEVRSVSDEQIRVLKNPCDNPETENRPLDCARGDKSCHAELVSASHGKEILKQVQNDNGKQNDAQEKNPCDTSLVPHPSSPIPSLDIGFRVLKVADSNMKDVYYSAAEYEQEKLDLFESNIKEDRNDLDLLFGCLLDWGLPLSLPYTSETTGKFTVHTYNGGDLVACFDEAVSEDVVKQIARKKPLRAVFRDSSFASSSSKINVFEIFKMISPETSVKVI